MCGEGGGGQGGQGGGQGGEGGEGGEGGVEACLSPIPVERGGGTVEEEEGDGVHQYISD